MSILGTSKEVKGTFGEGNRVVQVRIRLITGEKNTE